MASVPPMHSLKNKENKLQRMIVNDTIRINRINEDQYILVKQQIKEREYRKK